MEGSIDLPQGVRVHRFVVIIGIALVTVLTLSDGARAGGLADGWTDGNGVGAQTNHLAGTQPVVGHPTVINDNAPVCTYTLRTGGDAENDERFSQGEFGPKKGAEPGAWYRQICVDAAGNSTGLIVWRTQANVDPAALARQALDYSLLPTPQLTLNPSADKLQIVSLPVWLAIPQAAWKPVSASASSEGVGVTTTATPSKVVWNTGDGATVTCSGPGTPYDPSRSAASQKSDCTHSYMRSSVDKPNGTYALTATVQWHVTWKATGVPAGMPAQGDLGVVGRSATVAIRVGEVQTVNQGK